MSDIYYLTDDCSNLLSAKWSLHRGPQRTVGKGFLIEKGHAFCVAGFKRLRDKRRRPESGRTSCNGVHPPTLSVEERSVDRRLGPHAVRSLSLYPFPVGLFESFAHRLAVWFDGRYTGAKTRRASERPLPFGANAPRARESTASSRRLHHAIRRTAGRNQKRHARP